MTGKIFIRLRPTLVARFLVNMDPGISNHHGLLINILSIKVKNVQVQDRYTRSPGIYHYHMDL